MKIKIFLLQVLQDDNDGEFWQTRKVTTSLEEAKEWAGRHQDYDYEEHAVEIPVQVQAL